MTHESYLSAWQQSQELAESMQPLIGKLYRNQGVEISVHARPLLNASTIEIIKAHRVASRHEGKALLVSQSYPILKVLSELDLAPASIDLGKLAVSYWELELN